KLTRPLILSVVGSNLGFFQYGYMFFLVTNPVVRKMPLVTLQGINTQSSHFQLLILIAIIFILLGGLFGVYLWSCLADRYGRGALVTSSVLFFSWGHLLVQILISPQIWGNEENFSLLVGIIGIFAIISSILLLLSLESPRFLYLQKNNEEKARQVLKELRGEEDVEEEMEELRQEHLAESSQNNMTVWKLLCFRSLRWHVITVVVLVSGSQFVEINSVSDSHEQSLIGFAFAQFKFGVSVLPQSAERWLNFRTVRQSCESHSISRMLRHPADASDKHRHPCSGLHQRYFDYHFLYGPHNRTRFSYLGPYFLLVHWPFIVLTYIYIFRAVPETCGKTFLEIQENLAACTSKNSRKIMAE
ncbi:hypothetical protein E2320_006283, partial [Naja naja]